MRPSSSAHCYVVSPNYFGLLFVLFLRALICIEQALALFEAVFSVGVSFKVGYLRGGGGGQGRTT